MSTALADLIDTARRTGRCLACDGPTRRFAHGEYHRALCGHADCRRTYDALYHEAHRERRLRRQRQMTAERRAS